MAKSIEWFKTASTADILKEPNQQWEEIKEHYFGYEIIAGNYLNGGFSSMHPKGYGNSWYYKVNKTGKYVYTTLECDNHSYGSAEAALMEAKKFVDKILNQNDEK